VELHSPGWQAAITPDGAFAYVTNPFSNSVTVIDTASQKIVTTIEVGLRPFGVAITPDGTFAYVTNQNSNSVSVIDTDRKVVVDTVEVGPTPNGVAITPDGAFAYVSNFRCNCVSVIATKDNTVVATVKVGKVPFALAITPEGTFAYVTNGAGTSVSIIDTASNTVVGSVDVGFRPAGVAITPDGSFAYVTNLETIPALWLRFPRSKSLRVCVRITRKRSRSRGIRPSTKRNMPLLHAAPAARPFASMLEILVADRVLQRLLSGGLFADQPGSSQQLSGFRLPAHLAQQIRIVG
jgi:YVTN family beta-propeller protein